MKQAKFLTLFLFFVLAISCRKESDNTTETATVNTNLTLAKSELAVVAPIRNLTSYFWVEKLSDADVLYIHNSTNTGNIEDKGMMSYSISGNTFTDLAYSEEFAAAGFMSKLISVGGLYLYYCANDFVRHNRFSGTWDEGTEYPSNIYENNGETGVCVFDRDIYFIGGRIATTTVKFYNTDTKIWTNAADYPLNIGRTTTATDDARYIYSLGGDDGINEYHTKEFYRFDTQNNSWEQLDDCPQIIRQSYVLNLMCFFKDKYLAVLCEDKKIYIYNTESKLWQPNGIETGLTIDVLYAHLEASTDKSKFYVAYKKDNNQLGISEYTPN